MTNYGEKSCMSKLHDNPVPIFHLVSDSLSSSGQNALGYG